MKRPPAKAGGLFCAGAALPANPGLLPPAGKNLG